MFQFHLINISLPIFSVSFLPYFPPLSLCIFASLFSSICFSSHYIPLRLCFSVMYKFHTTFLSLLFSFPFSQHFSSSCFPSHHFLLCAPVPVTLAHLTPFSPLPATLAVSIPVIVRPSKNFHVNRTGLSSSPLSTLILLPEDFDHLFVEASFHQNP